MGQRSFSDVFNLADYFLFDRIGEGLGETVALRFGNEVWTYNDVATRSARTAAVLVSLGVRAEERVLIVLPDLPPFAWSLFGTLRAGAVVAMGNPDAPVGDLAYLLEYTRAAALITVPRVLESLADVIERSPWLRAVLVTADVPTGDDPEAEVHAPALGAGPRIESLTRAIATVDVSSHKPTPTRRDDIAVWLFTSGSTGKPKAAVHTHRDFAYNTEVYALGTVGYRRGDMCVSVPRLFFGYATGTNLMFPFRVGATVGLFSERVTAQSLTEAITRYRPTVLTNVPTMIGKLLEHDMHLRATGSAGIDLSGLRFCLSAGEALPPTLLARWLERFNVDVYDGIGSAEMFHIYVSNRPGDVKPGSLGRVVDGYEVKILARDALGPGAEALPSGEVGALWVAGDSVALCYHGDRDKSWETFHGRWCRTSDLFRIDGDGYLWFAGRADDLLKVSGQWVSPIEIEDCLLTHPAIAEVVVVGYDDKGLTKTRAHVVLRDGFAAGEALAKDIQVYARDRLARHKYPRDVRFVDDLPKNDRGKVDRKLFR
jgi:benzoate-CoA ligase family protein